ncbi:TcpD family membrane protein [Ruminiclostridium papyrosolvens]|uniref:Uncharacterized protein n=1 Tax=Ruminiclostridium papyrosolvens C7 TaxID=1330534 RepID=U4R375_9FIRM|nr:TcpD family membrane protein [Ruminiclostridium papyrosolvens]EPR12059.1 hypothetical protein L323_09950 [Ruminiclostridium papyrosolvens C7]
MLFLKRNMPRVISVLILVIVFSLFAVNVFAAGENFGQNAYTWLQSQIWFIALLIVAVICVPFIMKKMWMQLAGFLVLAAIVLYIVNDPTALKSLGSTIWSKIFN